MTALLDGLLVIGESQLAAEIESRWHSLLAVADEREPPDF